MRNGDSGMFALLLATLPLLAANFHPQSVNRAAVQDTSAFRDDGELVFIKSGSSTMIKTIQIEIADNDAERTQGLMWRQYMPENDGMLFIFDKQEPLRFWMKNTYIPLDMVFADKSGKIVNIYPEAAPFSEASIQSGEPAKYVVEVNGGFCASYGINVGDKIEYER